MIRRLHCWLDGHIYVLVRDFPSAILGEPNQERLICLRCLRGSARRLPQPPTAKR